MNPSEIAASAWGWQDSFTLGLFFAGMIGIVVWVVRQKEETSSDYFLAGRDAGWLAIGASIFASNIGSEHLVGLAGAGATTGMAMAHWEMHAWLILVLGWVFVPFYSRSMVYTMPEFLEKRFSPTARSFLSIISLVSYVLTKVAVTVYAGGVVFKQVLGIESWMGIDFFWIGAIGLVIVTGIYTVLGGMKSVLYTSVLQTPVLLVGSIMILVVGLIKVGGWGELAAIAQTHVTPQGDNMLKLVRSAQDPEFPWTGVLFASPIIGFWYWCTDQYIVQRVLSGRNQKEARRGTMFGAYLKLLPVFIFLIPGLIAFALSQKGMIHLDNPDAAFPTLVSTLLPAGMKGIVVGGLVAALMSSLASLFNSSATLFTVDFYKKYRPAASEKHLVYVGRVATAVVVVLGVLWIPVMRDMGQVLYTYLQDVQSLLAPGHRRRVRHGRVLEGSHRCGRPGRTHRRLHPRHAAAGVARVPGRPRSRRDCLPDDRCPQLAALLHFSVPAIAGDHLAGESVYSGPDSQDDRRPHLWLGHAGADRRNAGELESLGCDSHGDRIGGDRGFLCLFLVGVVSNSGCGKRKLSTLRLPQLRNATTEPRAEACGPMWHEAWGETARFSQPKGPLPSQANERIPPPQEPLRAGSARRLPPAALVPAALPSRPRAYRLSDSCHRLLTRAARIAFGDFPGLGVLLFIRSLIR